MILPLPAKTPIPALPPAMVSPARLARVSVRALSFDDGTTAVVRGRRMRFKDEDWNQVRVLAVGRDGTVLIQRACVGGPRWTIEEFIVHGRKETRVLAFGQPANVTGYVDAHHYLAAFKRPGEEDAPPIFLPPHLLVVDGGAKRLVGTGYPLAWAPGREAVANVDVGEGVQHTCAFEGGNAYDLGTLTFRVRLPSGISVFGDDAGGVWTWDHGHLNPWVRLSTGWVPVASSSSGLLVRRGDGWETGLLRGRVFTRLRFAPPVGLDWTEIRGFRPDGSFRVYATDWRDRDAEVDVLPAGSA